MWDGIFTFLCFYILGCDFLPPRPISTVNSAELCSTKKIGLVLLGSLTIQHLKRHRWLCACCQQWVENLSWAWFYLTSIKYMGLSFDIYVLQLAISTSIATNLEKATGPGYRLKILFTVWSASSNNRLISLQVK